MIYGVYTEKFDIANKLANALASEAFKVQKEKGYISIKRKSDSLVIVWGYGHMCELYQAKDYSKEYNLWTNLPIPFIPAEYLIKVREGVDYKTGKKTGEADQNVLKQLDLVKRLFNKCDKIVIATDDDREGELIFSYVKEYTKLRGTFLRMKISSLTKEGIEKAFNNMVSAETCKGVEDAGRCRAIADWLLGANLTSNMTLKYRYCTNLPMITLGRVQTAVLNFIVNREFAIRNFKVETFYKIEGLLSKDNFEFKGVHETRFKSKEEAIRILKKLEGNTGKVLSKTVKKMEIATPMLLNLADLQRAANECYGYKADETLELAQSLYEKGLISYPRTSSNCLTDDMEEELKTVLKMLAMYNSDYLYWIGGKDEWKIDDKYFNSKEVDSHYAIIPTSQKPNSLNEKESNVYDIIAKSVIRTLYGSHIVEKTSVLVDINGEIFKVNGSVILDAGWKKVTSKVPRSEEYLPKLLKGDVVDVKKLEIKEGKTEAPKRYTDATLLTAMQTASKEIDDKKLKEMLNNKNKGGIGRPSTQANIIKTVVDRYCTRKGKSIVPSEDAIKVIELLPIADLKSAEMTAELESKLDDVEKGLLKKDDFIKEIEKRTGVWSRMIKNSSADSKLALPSESLNTELKCPKCGSQIYKTNWGYTCSKRKEGLCDFSLGYEFLHCQLNDDEIKNVIIKGKTEKQHKFKKDDGSEFTAYLTYSDGKLRFDYDTGLICPKCGKPIKFSSEGRAYCLGYKEGCNFYINSLIASKRISENTIRQIINRQRTDIIRGFKTKDGRGFQSRLKLDDNNNVVFCK